VDLALLAAPRQEGFVSRETVVRGACYVTHHAIDLIGNRAKVAFTKHVILSEAKNLAVTSRDP